MRVYVVVISWFQSMSEVVHASESQGDAYAAAQEASSDRTGWHSITMQTWCEGEMLKDEVLFD